MFPSLTPHARFATAAFGAVLLGSVFVGPAMARQIGVAPAAHPGVVPVASSFGPRRVAAPRSNARVPFGVPQRDRVNVFKPGFGPFSTFPFGHRGFGRGGFKSGFGFPFFGNGGFGGETTARAAAEATASPRTTTAIVNVPGDGQAAAPAPTVTIPNPRLSDEALAAAGLAASGGGEGAAGVRRTLGDIAAAREAERLSQRTGSRYLYVDEDLRELATERRALRKAEGRGRNRHILYLGFDH